MGAQASAQRGEGVHECAWFRRRPAASLCDQPPSYTLESGRKVFRHPESRKRRGKTILKTRLNAEAWGGGHKPLHRRSSPVGTADASCSPTDAVGSVGGCVDGECTTHSTPPAGVPPHAARHGTPHGTAHVELADHGDCAADIAHGQRGPGRDGRQGSCPKNAQRRPQRPQWTQNEHCRYTRTIGRVFEFRKNYRRAVWALPNMVIDPWDPPPLTQIQQGRYNEPVWIPRDGQNLA